MASKTADLSREMIGLGLDEPFAEYIGSIKASAWPYLFMVGLILFVMVGGFAAGGYFFFEFAVFLKSVAKERAAEVGGILYREGGGWSVLVALFGWIFATGYLISRSGFYSENFIGNVVASSASADQLNLAIIRRSLNKTLTWSSQRERTAHAFRALGGWGKWPAIVLLGTTITLMGGEWHSGETFTRSGVVSKQNYGFGEWKERRWSSETTVKLGCNHVTGQSASDDPVYRIIFANGAGFDLEDARPVEGNWLDALEQLDAALVEAGVQFERWSWQGRDPLHPECLEANRSSMSAEDYQRLLTLLRVTTEELGE